MSETETARSTSKEQIADRFGNAAAYYREHATVQKEVASRLIASLNPWKDIIPPGPILEVGCGTGFVTEGLKELYPNRSMEITDLATEMVEYCAEYIGKDDKLEFRVMDAEEFDHKQKRYSLIISGFTAQWFKDPALTLGRLLESVKPGGLLLASFPGNESFPEWREHCRELGIPFTGNELPDTEEVVIKLSTGPAQVDFYEDTVTETYDDAASFFRHLKKVGAGTRTKGRPLKPSEMKLLIDYWNKTAEGKINVSYHVVFLAVKRDFSS